MYYDLAPGVCRREKQCLQKVPVCIEQYPIFLGYQFNVIFDGFILFAGHRCAQRQPLSACTDALSEPHDDPQIVTPPVKFTGVKPLRHIIQEDIDDLLNVSQNSLRLISVAPREGFEPSRLKEPSLLRPISYTILVSKAIIVSIEEYYYMN